jgi:hypothetical protein
MRKCVSSLQRNLIMQMVLNQKNQTPKHFFVRKNEAEMTARVAKFFFNTLNQFTVISALLEWSAGYERFPLVSSCQTEKPTT